MFRAVARSLKNKIDVVLVVFTLSSVSKVGSGMYIAGGLCMLMAATEPEGRP